MSVQTLALYNALASNQSYRLIKKVDEQLDVVEVSSRKKKLLPSECSKQEVLDFAKSCFSQLQPPETSFKPRKFTSIDDKSAYQEVVRKVLLSDSEQSVRRSSRIAKRKQEAQILDILSDSKISHSSIVCQSNALFNKLWQASIVGDLSKMKEYYKMLGSDKTLLLSRFKDCLSPLQEICFFNHLDALKWVKEELGEDKFKATVFDKNSTILCIASNGGSLDVVKYLYSIDKNILKLKTDDQSNCLMYALSASRLNVCEWIVEQEKNLLDDVNVRGLSCLHYALLTKKKETFDWLQGHRNFSEGVLKKTFLDSCRKNETGSVELFLEMYPNFLCEEALEKAAIGGNVDLFMKLTDKMGCSIFHKIGKFQLDLFHILCRFDHKEEALKLLEKYPEFATTVDADHETAFIKQLYDGKLDLAKAIYEKDPSCFSINTKGEETPLHLVCESKKANVDAVEWVYSIHPQNLYAKDAKGGSPIMKASIGNNLQALEFLLSKDMNLIHERLKSQENLLHVFFYKKDVENLDLLNFLIEKKFSLLQEEMQTGELPCHFAAKFGKLSSLKRMISVDPKVIFSQTRSGVNLLNLGCYYGKDDVVEYLLDKEPKILDLEVPIARDPFAVALAFKQFNIFQSLIRAKTPSTDTAISKKMYSYVHELLNRNQIRIAQEVIEKFPAVLECHSTEKDRNILELHFEQKQWNPSFVLWLIKKNQNLVDINSSFQMHYFKLLGNVSEQGVLFCSRLCTIGLQKLAMKIIESTPKLLDFEEEGKNFLDIYCREEDVPLDFAKWLIDNKPSLLENQSRLDADAFAMSCYRGRMDLVELFYKKYPKILENKLSDSTYMHYVCSSESPDAIKILELLIKAKPSMIYDKNKLAFIAASRAVYTDRLDLLKMMAEKDPSVLHTTSSEGHTLATQVADSKKLECAEYLYERAPDLFRALPRQVDDKNWVSFLQVAMERKDDKALKFLANFLPGQLYLRMRNSRRGHHQFSGLSLMHLAIEDGNLEHFKFFVDFDLNFIKKTHSGKERPLKYLFQTEGDTPEITQGKFEILKYSFENFGNKMPMIYLSTYLELIEARSEIFTDEQKAELAQAILYNKSGLEGFIYKNGKNKKFQQIESVFSFLKKYHRAEEVLEYERLQTMVFPKDFNHFFYTSFLQKESGIADMDAYLTFLDDQIKQPELPENTNPYDVIVYAFKAINREEFSSYLNQSKLDLDEELSADMIEEKIESESSQIESFFSKIRLDKDDLAVPEGEESRYYSHIKKIIAHFASGIINNQYTAAGDLYDQLYYILDGAQHCYTRFSTRLRQLYINQVPNSQLAVEIARQDNNSASFDDFVLGCFDKVIKEQTYQAYTEFDYEDEYEDGADVHIVALINHFLREERLYRLEGDLYDHSQQTPVSLDYISEKLGVIYETAIELDDPEFPVRYLEVKELFIKNFLRNVYSGVHEELKKRILEELNHQDPEKSNDFLAKFTDWLTSKNIASHDALEYDDKYSLKYLATTRIVDACLRQELDQS